MDKIVGKIFCALVCLILTVTVQAQLIFRAFDAQGNALKQAVVGQPFFLEVAMDNVSASAQESKPTITDAQHAYVRYNGIEMVNINGKISIKYRYKARIDNPGQFTLGPARIADGTKIIKSAPLTITVVEQSMQPTKLAAATGRDESDAFLRLTTDISKAVVGQKIQCTLGFYYTSDVVNVTPFNQPQVNGATFGQTVTQDRGQKKINGKDYQYFQITWDAYATQPGKLVIPAYSMDFAVQTRQANSFFAQLLGSMLTSTKRVYSNAVTIAVDALPPHKGPVHAIGSYTNFSARLDPLVAKEGEGMVLTFEVEGSGIIDKVTSLIAPHSLPASFKYYDSKNYSSAPDQNGMQKESFEYIVQGLEKGQWHIARQEFTFFDTKSGNYKTLYSQPISVIILAGTAKNSKNSFGADPSTKQLEDEIDIEIKPLVTQSSSQKQMPIALPFWLFLFTCCVPAMLWMHEAFTTTAQRFFGLQNIFKQKTVFSDAHKLVNSFAQQNKYDAMLGIFVEIFARKYKQPVQNITGQYITLKLAQAGLDAQKIEEWDQFFLQLNQLTFFAKVTKLQEHTKFIQLAHDWIDRLEKVL